MSKKIITTENAPAAIGPYSQAVQYGDTIYVSGQLPLNPETKKWKMMLALKPDRA